MRLYARGEVTEDRDVDLLVVMRDFASRRETSVAILLELASIALQCDCCHAGRVGAQARRYRYGDPIGSGRGCCAL
ncbi:MAG: nucleotidyltransferase domain-containing protein [Longimicrobiales bacterium]